MFGVWILYGRSPAASDAPEARATAYAPTPYSALFDPGVISGSTPGSLAQSVPLDSNFTLLDPAPSAAIAELENEVPMSEPSIAIAELENDAPVVPPAAPQDNRSFFEKLFGAPQASLQASKHVLAYAAPEDSIFDNAKGIFGSAKSIASNPSNHYDQWTAVYDVAAHTVYLPNGARLEAHSGLGSRLDDPRYVSERMRGATPPNVYALQPREQPFHGVRALRLTPIGNGSVYGRTGLLAHTYMLGPHGDSNGCVSFKNYNAFLQAYQNGEIKRLAVVSRLN